MSSNVIKCHQKNFRNFFSVILHKEFSTFKFLSIANFFPEGTPNFLTPDLKSTIKSSSIKGGQIPKNVMLSSSQSPIKTQETIFEVDIPARVKLRKRTHFKNCEAKAKRSRVHFVRSEFASLRNFSQSCEFALRIWSPGSRAR